MASCDTRLILASGSPRRRELLARFGLPFAVVPALGGEAAPQGQPPAELVRALARAKAEEVAARRDCRGALVIAADTVVELEGVILGKPAHPAEAADMLRSLSGRRHRVWTGLCLCRGEERLSGEERTDVYFRPLTEGEISAYVATGEPLDKAGAYGYQGLASLFVERIDGDYFNVVGLPLCRLGQMLREMGVILL